MSTPSALIVEDDHDVADLYDRVLQTMGLATEIISTGEGALARLATRVPDVVVLDLSLPPKVSGTDVLRQIRADPRLAKTRVVVVTGHPDMAEAVEDDADEVLLKPVDVNQLSELIARLLPGAESD